MLGKKCPREVNDVRDYLVLGVSPEGSELEAVAGFLRLPLAVFFLSNGAYAGRVGIVLGMRTVGDHEYLHVLVKAAAGPEAIPLITVDLIKCFLECNAAAFELNMNKRESVYEYGHVVAIIIVAAAFGVLVDDLQRIIVDDFLVDQRDVLGASVVALENLNVIFLNAFRFFYDTIVY